MLKVWFLQICNFFPEKMPGNWKKKEISIGNLFKSFHTFKFRYDLFLQFCLFGEHTFSALTKYYSASDIIIKCFSSFHIFKNKTHIRMIPWCNFCKNCKLVCRWEKKPYSKKCSTSTKNLKTLFLQISVSVEEITRIIFHYQNDKSYAIEVSYFWKDKSLN